MGRATRQAGAWSSPDQFLCAVGVVAHHAGADQSGAADGGVQAPACCAVAHGETWDVVVFHIFHASSIAYALGQKLSNPKKSETFFWGKVGMMTAYVTLCKSLIINSLQLRGGLAFVTR